MTPMTQRRWQWYARFFIAWMLVLFGLLLATPGIALVVEVVLPYFERAPVRKFFNAYTLSHIGVGVFYLGCPSIIIWSIASCVRSARAPHPVWFYAMALLAAGLLMSTDVWGVFIVYLGIGGVLQAFRLIDAQPPDDLVGRLAVVFPGFWRDWKDAKASAAGRGDAITYCAVFARFSEYYRERSESAASSELAYLGTVVNDCMNRASSDLRDAAAGCFLGPLRHEPCLARLRPYLSPAALEILDASAIVSP